MTDNSTLKGDALIAETWCNMRINKVNQCSFMWTIDDYFDYHHYSEEAITSTTFKSTTYDQCEWFLLLSSPQSDQIHLYLCLCYDSKAAWCEKVFAKCEMSILNNSREKTNIQKSVRYHKLKLDSVNKNKYYVGFKSFFTSADVLSKKIVVDGKLTIFCQFEFVVKGEPGFLEYIIMKSVPTEENDADDSLINDLKNLCITGTFSDFIITVDGQDHPVHKNILAARSPVFATMFKQNMKEQKENRLEITDLRKNVVDEMLRYIYTGRIHDWETTAFELLQAAEKYDLKELKNMCQFEIMKKLSVENVVNSLLLADLYRAPLLKEQAVQFMKIHLTKVMKTESWCKFKASRVFNEISDDLLM